MEPTACQYCKEKRRSCNRRHPCDRCLGASQVCEFRPDRRQQRPSVRLVDALRGQIKSLEEFISSVVIADTWEREAMLSAFHLNHAGPPTKEAKDSSSHGGNYSNEAAIAPKGKRINAKGSSPGVFVGETASWIPHIGPNLDGNLNHHQLGCLEVLPLFDTAGPSCKNTMRLFFNKTYTSYMFLYREYFLRDYDACGGPYYSDLLMYAICAMGALVGSSWESQLSEIFARRCEELLFSAELEHSSFTTLQALLLMGTRAVGRGQHGKGWQFTGMAFRMITEMGLYQDPVHWEERVGTDLQREIFRRVYWAAFVLDKQLSLLYGRPPVIQPQEADVQATIRIPYPSEWRVLLPKYLCPGTTPESYEKGEELVAAFVQKVELCKIIHRMWTHVFARHRATTDASILEMSKNQVHVDLQRWHIDLPISLRWYKSTKTIVPPYTIELHMLFYTALMVLHRPPTAQIVDSSILYTKYGESLKICREAMEATIFLIKATKDNFKLLPFTFPHTAATAASILLALRDIGQQEDHHDEWQQLLVDALDGVSLTWASAKTVRDAIAASNCQQMAGQSMAQSPDFGILASWNGSETFDEFSALDPDLPSDLMTAEHSMEQLSLLGDMTFLYNAEPTNDATEQDWSFVGNPLGLEDANLEQ